eukprot:CAMPEP_0178428418 /NCGR_PEP_ID=MMETSP0689_2-20121128/30268_1 /TAXON_ID=160604 /ORGANISM="Amphidinium massartii, Strain CS-259" /LENGTH=880 /DNA_ID=CAMNT_0020050191 /DNA_START=142 /DNA_END=2784 /DNA_ORIENTATION=+
MAGLASLQSMSLQSSLTGAGVPSSTSLPTCFLTGLPSTAEGCHPKQSLSSSQRFLRRRAPPASRWLLQSPGAAGGGGGGSSSRRSPLAAPTARRVSEVTQIVQSLPLQVPNVSHLPYTGFLPWLLFIFACTLQLGGFPLLFAMLARIFRRLRSRKLQLKTLEDIEALKTACTDGRLRGSVEIQGKVLPEGTLVVGADEAVRGEPPQRIFYRKKSRFSWLSGSKAKLWRSGMTKVRGMLKLARGPVLMQCWGYFITEILATWVIGYVPKRSLPAFAKIVGRMHFICGITGLAWFGHRLTSYWRDQRSRGRAVLTDVLGGESSLREARVNALKVFVQFLIWAAYTTTLLAIAGISPGNVLLVPGVAAVLLGWVGRQVLANIISGLVLHLTQPFAQGDWVTVGDVDGWVQDISMFYTKIMQWDKRPMYIPNSDIMATNVQNNSRMTNRRVLFDLKLPLRCIPQIPQIVQDLQEMVENHEDVDDVQHRLVRWRRVDDWCATIWLSCYTLPSWEGISLKNFTKIEQSVLERASSIIYKHGAEFASNQVRHLKSPAALTQGASGVIPFVDNEVVMQDGSTKIVDDKAGDGSVEDRSEKAWKAREEALWQRERAVKTGESQLDTERQELQQEQQELKSKEKSLEELLHKYEALSSVESSSSSSDDSSSGDVQDLTRAWVKEAKEVLGEREKTEEGDVSGVGSSSSSSTSPSSETRSLLDKVATETWAGEKSRPQPSEGKQSSSKKKERKGSKGVVHDVAAPPPPGLEAPPEVVAPRRPKAETGTESTSSSSAEEQEREEPHHAEKQEDLHEEDAAAEDDHDGDKKKSKKKKQEHELDEIDSGDNSDSKSPESDKPSDEKKDGKARKDSKSTDSAPPPVELTVPEMGD